MIQRIITLIFLLITVTLIPNNALARDGIFLTLQTGWAEQSGLPQKPYPSAINSRRDSPGFPSAYNIGLGYNHDFFHWIGFGLFVAFGRYGGTVYYFDGNHQKITNETLEFLGRLMFHITHHWDAFLIAGGIRANSVLSGEENRSGLARIEPQVGFGGAYNFNNHIAFIVSFNHASGKIVHNIYGDIGPHTQPSLNEIMGGLQIIFG